MKNLNVLVLLAAGLMLTVTSCKKEEEPAPTTTTPTTPTAPTAPTPTVAGVNGAMVAVRTDFSYTQMGVSVPLNTEMAVAAFWANVGDANMVDAGAVSVNGHALTKNANNSYTVIAGIPLQEPADLGLDGTIHWSVAGNSNVNNINRNATGLVFPDYTGPIPTDITKADGLNLNFTSGTTVGADSVYILLVSGDKTFMKAVGAAAGNVMITAADMANLSVSSSTSYAYLEIVPWKVTDWFTDMGRTYAFVSEKAIIRTINLK